jgi:hypothetical protein
MQLKNGININLLKKKNLNMKYVLHLSLIIILFLSIPVALFSQENQKQDCVFKTSSLHHTVNGMSYWYDKSRGGLETITGIPYADLNCNTCHVENCDVCHKTEKEDKTFYTNEAANNQDMCLKCHGREAAIMNIDKKNNTEDVHFAAGMECMDCHTQREMHGDGVVYTSMKQPGAMDVKCEECHAEVGKSISHTIHKNNVDCNSCHVQQVVSCTNCHFETMVKEGKRVSIPVSGWEFLMNYNGKVTSANMQTFVVSGNKTFLMFAPQFSHSVYKNGKKCEECHANTNVKKTETGSIDLTWLENGNVVQTKGVIPIVEGVQHNSFFQNYKEGKWTPVENPEKPVVQYVGFGNPLTKEQLNKLLKPQQTKDGNK